MSDMWRVITLILLLSFPALAENNSASIQFGVDVSSGKILSLSYTRKIPTPFIIEPSIGIINKDNFFNSTQVGFAALSAGVKADTYWGLYGKATVGPAYITKTDDKLGTNYQMLLGVGIGIEGERASVGGIYRHFSNGGLSDINKGRDFLGLEASIKF